MISDIESGIIDTVIVKDLSRLGRDHITVGYYTEKYFPDKDVRFIAIFDSVDSFGEENEFAPFKNIINEWYARDTSRKVKAVLQNKGIQGGILNSVPVYGYRRDSTDKNRWLIDEEAAENVRLIFSLYADGQGCCKIASRLHEMGVLTPAEYQSCKGLPTRRPTKKRSCKWSAPTIHSVLTRQEYLGDIVNFKSARRSYKDSRIVKNKEDSLAVFKGINEPIISEELWERVQQRLSSREKKRPESSPALFGGYLYCADCGKRLSAVRPCGRNPAHYLCNSYKADPTSCTVHYIREELLKQRVISSLNSNISAYRHNSAEYEKKLLSMISDESDNAEADLLTKRSAECEAAALELYKDKTAGRISEERFELLQSACETERAQIAERMLELCRNSAKRRKQREGIKLFLGRLSKYPSVENLSPQLLAEFVEKIEVCQYKKCRPQQVRIFYKDAGYIDETVLPT